MGLWICNRELQNVVLWILWSIQREIQTLATIEAGSHFSGSHALCFPALNYLSCIKTLFFNPVVFQIYIVCEKELGI